MLYFFVLYTVVSLAWLPSWWWNTLDGESEVDLYKAEQHKSCVRIPWDVMHFEAII